MKIREYLLEKIDTIIDKINHSISKSVSKNAADSIRKRISNKQICILIDTPRIEEQVRGYNINLPIILDETVLRGCFIKNNNLTKLTWESLKYTESSEESDKKIASMLSYCDGILIVATERRKQDMCKMIVNEGTKQIIQLHLKNSIRLRLLWKIRSKIS